MSPKAYNRLLLVVAGLGGLLYGIDVGIIASALPYLEASSGLNAGQLSFVVAAVLLGSVLSTLFAGLLADWLGRKKLMLLSGLLFVASIPLIALADGFTALILGRLLQGLSAGLIGVVVPLYLAECLSPETRGRGTGLFQWMLTLGIVAAALIGIYFSMRVDEVSKLGDASALLRFKDHAWRSIFWASLPPGLLFCVGALMVGESPRWLFSRGAHELCRRALLKSRDAAATQLELKVMADNLAGTPNGKSGSTTGGSLFQRRYVLPFLLACVILACNQATGVNSIIGYNTTILLQSGLSDVAAHWGYLILTAVNFLVTMAAVALVDKMGRKFLLSLGSAGIVLSLLGVGFLFRSNEARQSDVAQALRTLQTEPDRLLLDFDREKLGVLDHRAFLSGEPQSLVVIYSYGDFRAATKVARTNDPSSAHLELTRESCLPSNRVIAFFGNPFANLEAARTAPLRIEHALLTPIPDATHGWLTAGGIFLFMAFFAIGPGVCVWLALSELMPTRIRSNGMSIALLLNQAVSTGIAAAFLPLVGQYGYATLFFGFAGCTVIYFITAFYFLPETKGRTLEEIEDHFSGKSSKSAPTRDTTLVGLLLLGLFLGASSGSNTACAAEPQKSPADEVNVFIGTGGHGHTFPGACVPFGMVQVSPDTRVLGWDACAGYHYSDDFIHGFSHTHLSGVGIPDYCDLLLAPQSGIASVDTPDPTKGRRGYGSRFSHARETASPGYYAVDLLDHDIRVELTATTHTATHRYTFANQNGKSLLIDLEHRDLVLNSFLEQNSPTSFQGYRRSAAWAKDQLLFFALQLNCQPESVEFYENGVRMNGAPRSASSKIKALLRFPDSFTQPIVVRVGLSPTGMAGAAGNLAQENRDADFENAQHSAKSAWNEVLSRFSIHGGTSEQRINFYTSLYHCYVTPNRFDDAPDQLSVKKQYQYRGRDGKLHTSDHPYYTIFSLWDTFRAWHPLMTLMEPEASTDFIRTFLLMHQQGGLLPVWDLAGNETFCMNGYHAVSVIADAYAKGIRNFDTTLALEAMQNSATRQHFGLGAYQREGFIAREQGREGVARTLEYAYDDWCIADFADRLGKTDVSNTFLLRSQSYRQLFNRSEGFFMARENGAWYAPFNSHEINFNYTEGNAWHYRFAAQHDLLGLQELLGGPEGMGRALDDLFNAPPVTEGREQADVTGLIGQYAHGNEPSHHVAYLYNYVGRPSETQKRVREIMTTLYTNSADGLCGNDDCGQMSAWYVFSALGFYPVTPGLPEYVIGSPLFEKATLSLPNGKSFTVIAVGQAPAAPYISAATLNGTPLDRTWLSHEEIMTGGHLVLTMSKSPGTWGQALSARPGHKVKVPGFVEAPLLSVPISFKGSTTLSITAFNPVDELWYTLDGSVPVPGKAQRYVKPVTLSTNTTIQCLAVRGNASSPVARAETHRHDAKWSIVVNSDINRQYQAGGPQGLIDDVLGGPDFTTGRWQGYEGCPFEAIVDLGSVKTLKSASIGFLQDSNSYIFYPKDLLIEGSDDGIHFRTLARVNAPAEPRDTTRCTVARIGSALSAKARFLRFRAENPGLTLAWGSANDYIKSFLFCDEIQIDHD